MSTIELNESNFASTIEDNDIVVVDWWATWCGPCRTFAPVFEDAARRHDGIVFGKVDTEANPRLSSAAGIMSIPTLMIFREGVLVFSQPGAMPGAVLDQLLAKVRDLDMGKVRASVAEAGA